MTRTFKNLLLTDYAVYPPESLEVDVDSRYFNGSFGHPDDGHLEYTNDEIAFRTTNVRQDQTGLFGDVVTDDPMVIRGIESGLMRFSFRGESAGIKTKIHGWDIVFLTAAARKKFVKLLKS